MGPDSQWGDTRDGFGVSGIHEIQQNTYFFSDSWESGYFAKNRDSVRNSLLGSNSDPRMECVSS